MAHLDAHRSKSLRCAPVSPKPNERSRHDERLLAARSAVRRSQWHLELLNFPPWGDHRGTSDTQIPSLKSRRSWTALPWQNPASLRRRAWNLEGSRTTRPNATRHDAAASADRRGSDDRRGPRGSCEDHRENVSPAEMRYPRWNVATMRSAFVIRLIPPSPYVPTPRLAR